MRQTPCIDRDSWSETRIPCDPRSCCRRICARRWAVRSGGCCKSPPRHSSRSEGARRRRRRLMTPPCRCQESPSLAAPGAANCQSLAAPEAENCLSLAASGAAAFACSRLQTGCRRGMRGAAQLALLPTRECPNAPSDSTFAGLRWLSWRDAHAGVHLRRAFICGRMCPCICKCLW